MASIKEAYDSTMKEAFTGIKIFLWAIPLSIAFTSGGAFNYTVAAIVSFLLLGFIITLAHNVISKAPAVVPSINFIQMAINAVLGIIAILPYAAIGGLIYWGYSFVTIPDHPNWDLTFRIVVGLFCVSLPLTSVCILVRRMNILEVFNIKKYLYGVWTTFLDYSWFMIRCLLCLSIFIGFLVYIFTLFIGFENSFWTYLLGVAAMLLIILSSNAIAQISDDIYIFPEKEEDKRREDALVKEIMDNQSKIKDAR